MSTPSDDRRFSSEQEDQAFQAARESVEAVAALMGKRKRWVIRKYRKGRADVVAAVNAEATIRGQKIDPKRLREILELILSLIRALLPLFL